MTKKRTINQNPGEMFVTAPNDTLVSIGMTDTDVALLKIGNFEGLTEAISIKLNAKYNTEYDSLKQTSDDVFAEYKQSADNFDAAEKRFIADVKKKVTKQFTTELLKISRAIEDFTGEPTISASTVEVSDIDDVTVCNANISIKNLAGVKVFTTNKKMVLSKSDLSEIESFTDKQTAKAMKDLAQTRYEQINSEITKLMVTHRSLRYKAESLANDWIMANSGINITI